MSLKPLLPAPVPEQTVRVARAAFPKNNLYLRLRDELGTLWQDTDFAHLFAHEGQPALSPWRLALVCVMQFAERLSDRQAADAVRGRLDWKYALGMELEDSGFHYSVLSEFRSRLLAGSSEQLLLDKLLEVFAEQGLLKARGKQRTDSTHVLAAVRRLNYLELVGETLRHALNTLAAVAGDWLSTWVPEDWFERYNSRIEASRLPKKVSEQQHWVLQVGRDGHTLLERLWADPSATTLRQLEAVEILRCVWVQQYYLEQEQVHCRSEEERPPQHLQINSPYDLDGRSRLKRQTSWCGYSVHLTETCAAQTPHFVVYAETSTATVTDTERLVPIQQALEAKGLLARELYCDAGYVGARHLVELPRQYGVELIGPVLPDTSWQTQAGKGFESFRFQIDWQNQQVRCPMGKTSIYWSEGVDRVGEPLIRARFNRKDCEVCPGFKDCTTSAKYGRCVSFRPQEQHEALQQARAYQATQEFKERYQCRAGIEGTISEAVRMFGMRRSRYIGVAKTHLQQVAIAAAINLHRWFAWMEDRPTAATRVSRFQALDTAG